MLLILRGRFVAQFSEVQDMMALGINHILKSVQIIAGGRRYTCPMKESDGELYFKFKDEWHKVMEYSSELTDEFR